MFRILVWLLFALASGQLLAQPTTGLRFEGASFDSIPGLPTYTGEKETRTGPKVVDLTPFCPQPADQGNEQTCVAFATAYGAYAIQQAASLGKPLSPTEVTRQFALSPIFPLKRINHPCWEPLTMQAVGRFMTQNPSMRFREFSGVSCKAALPQRSPTVPAISDLLRIFSRTDDPDEKVLRVKRQLSHQQPVILGLNVAANFFNLQKGLYQPEPTTGRPTTAHAVVVVGYDDRRAAFKVLNSFGPNWGEKGFFWISYRDFARDAIAGLVLVMAEPDLLAGTGKPLRLGGRLGIRAVHEQADSLRYDTLTVQQVAPGMYQLRQQVQPLGQAFQLLTENTQPGEYMCVFSLDATDKLTVHFPRNRALASYNPALATLNESDLLPFNGFDSVLPDAETALTLDTPGTDYLCVLFSRQPLLPNLPALLSRLKAAKGTIQQRLAAALDQRLLTRTVRYLTDKMQFEAQTEGPADTVALLLRLETAPKKP
ncbi:C1 family peptidase [Rudanella lutea]|uniref:C1 family peptidase n=1 Tax=Rudanella lutea TaxID=451374 RepID=UPI000367798F|nr:C1 family peptidase [Rudanella lutea]